MSTTPPNDRAVAEIVKPDPIHPQARTTEVIDTGFHFLPLLLVLVASVVMPLVAAAQGTTGSISGTVVDESKSVVPGASVEVRHVETGIARALLTDADGRFRALNLPPGAYDVIVELSGFRTAVRDHVVVTIGTDVMVDVQLQVGAVAEAVTVPGEATILDTSAAVVGGLVTTQQIAELPLNGRSFTQLATLQPGVNVSRATQRDFTGGFGNTQLSIGGGRPEQTGYLLDGTNIADVSDKAPGSIAGVLLGVDTVQEFSVQTHGYSAEFGRASGGIISAVTKSGTNRVRGSVFEFHRNSAMDAKNFFDGENQPTFIRNQFGGTVGGPIRKNRLFFFGSYEALRERLGTTRLARLPNAAAHQGLVPNAATGLLENVGVHPLLRPYLDLLFPIPNGRDFGDGSAELRHSPTAPTEQDYFVAKVDWQLSPNESVSIRFTRDVSDTQQITDNPLFANVKDAEARYFSAHEQHLFRQNLLNTVRFSINRSERQNTPTPLIDIPRNLYFTDSPFFGTFTLTGLTGAGTNEDPIRYQQDIVEVADTLTWNTGRHTWKYGFDLQRYHFDGFSDSNPGGEFRFRDLREFLTLRRSGTALADRFRGMLPGADTSRQIRQNYVAFFAHDDFRVSARLSVSLGLRYEFATTPTEKNGLFAGLLSLDDLESGPLGVTPGAPLFDNPSNRRFAPRLGFSWLPTGSTKMSVRGGYGIFYQPLTPSFYRGTAFRVFPYFAGVDMRQPTVFGPGIQTVLNAGLTSADIQKRSEFILWDVQQPYVAQFHLTLQRELPGGFVGELGYLGSRGDNLPFYGDPNTVPAERLADGTKRVVPGAGLRFPSWGRIRTRKTVAESFYNGLVAGLSRRLTRGLQFQASYTFSKSIDDWSGGQIGSSDFSTSPGSATDWWDVRAERGLSAFDVRHNFVFNAVYQLPWGAEAHGVAGAFARGWQLGTIVSVASGVPFTPFIGFDRAGDRQSDTDVQKPNLVPGASNNPVIGSVDNWYDATAFALPPAGFFGNLGRNTIIGPTLRTLDFSVFKNTTFLGSRVVQLRLETFNLLNRANFAPPGAGQFLFNSDGTRRAGATRLTATSTTARQIQLGLKILF